MAYPQGQPVAEITRVRMSITKLETALVATQAKLEYRRKQLAQLEKQAKETGK